MTLAFEARQPGSSIATYDQAIEAELAQLQAAIAAVPELAAYHPRWLAIQLLEGDADLLEIARAADHDGALGRALAAGQERLRAAYGDDLDVAFADQRYGFVHRIVGEVLERPASPPRSVSDQIDRIVTHRLLGMPIFLVLMYLVFKLVHTVSVPYLDWISAVIGGPIARWVGALLALARAPAWLSALAADGVLAGVGSVLAFTPGLIVMYAALGVLEDSGYMARAAFVMDRVMSALGLHGKAFVPLILGFGCNVPAVYATRTIEQRSARMITGLMIPFMSCSARLPVYVIFGLAFFPRAADWVILGLYVLGMVVAALIGFSLSRLVFPAGQSALLLELPPYRRPTARGLALHVWDHTRHFVRKAGTTLMAVSLTLWLLLHFPWGVASPRDSLFGRVSAAAAPALAPAGFGQWEAAGALITGFAAKEVVVTTMAQVYGADQAAPPAARTTFGQDLVEIGAGFADATAQAGQRLVEMLTPGMRLFPAPAEPANGALVGALQRAFTPLAALAFLVFVLLYVPCAATVAAQAQEFGWRWAGLAIAVQLIVPWLLATLIYQGGRLLGLQ